MWTVAIIFAPCSKTWQAGTLRFMEHALFKSRGLMAQHEQSQLFPEPFSLSSFIPPCFFLPFPYFFFLAVLLGWIRIRGIYLGQGSSSETCGSTAATAQSSRGLHRLIQRGLISAHYAEPEEKGGGVWIDI